MASLKVPPAARKLVKQASMLNQIEGTINDIYELEESIGSGSFASVIRARHKKTKEEYAVKIMRKANVKTDPKKLEMELKILHQVGHPHISKLHGVFDTDEALYIVMELARGGEVFTRIIEKDEYSEKEAQELVRNLVKALKYLHDRGIVHRDLKPENLLLAEKGNDTNVKIADFGLSKIMEAKMLQTACGSPQYVAPEVLEMEGYTQLCDMWSVGVITYVLLCGFAPFQHPDRAVLFDLICEGKYSYPSEDWVVISDTAKDFIDSLLVVDPSVRMSAEKALQHQWLQEAPKLRKINTGLNLRKYLDDYNKTKKSGAISGDLLSASSGSNGGNGSNGST